VDAPRQEAQWVLRAQSDDREALEQDVLIVVARKLVWLEEPGLFRPWVFRIASRAAFRHLKRERRWLGNDAALEDVAAPDPLPRDELLREPATMEGISPASRAVLVLHFQEEMALTTVAASLAIPLARSSHGWPMG
jgi:RNA polymerase sigma-70 factor, ECF subfamily